MFTRSTLPTLVALVLLAWGSCAAAETFDPHAAQRSWIVAQIKPLSSGDAQRAEPSWSRGAGSDVIEREAPVSSVMRSGFVARWLDDAAAPTARASGKLSFQRGPDDDRAGSSSASISLGRLNLNEPRSGPALGSVSQADLDRELAQLRDSVNRVRVVPQVSLGMRVKF
jgi:hypothetical protein